MFQKILSTLQKSGQSNAMQEDLSSVLSSLVSAFKSSNDGSEFVRTNRERIDTYPKNQHSLISTLLEAMDLMTQGDRMSRGFQRAIATLLPKSILHCHLDGSMNTDTVGKGACQRPDELAEPVTEPKAFADFLTWGFEEPLAFMQTEKQLSDAAYDWAIRQHDEGHIHAEVRFAPCLHVRKGLSYSQILAKTMEGLEKAQKDCGISLTLISAMYRNREVGVLVDKDVHSQQTADELVAFAKGYKGAVGLAVDIVGLEQATFLKEAQNKSLSLENRTFVEAYKTITAYNEVAKRRIHITAHAGEVPGSYENIYRAIELGAERIGHGVDIMKDPNFLTDKGEILERCKAITFEVCPTSNVHLGTQPSMSDHVVKEMIDAGFKVTINPDNMTANNTTSSRELAFLHEAFESTDAAAMFAVTADKGRVLGTNMRSFCETALQGAFIDDDSVRGRLSQCMEERFALVSRLLAD